MVSTLLCKPPSVAGLSTTITNGSTQWYLWQFVMHTIVCQLLFSSTLYTILVYQWSLSLSLQVYLD